MSNLCVCHRVHAATDMFNKLGSCKNGNFSLFFAILMVPILIAAGMLIDYTNLVRDNSSLQEAVDAATIASIIPKNISRAEREEIADTYIRENFKGNFSNSTLTINTTVNENTVSVLANASIITSIMNVVGIKSLDHNAVATATLQSNNDICVLALNKTSPDTITVWGASSQIETTCGVHSNSTSSSGLTNSSKTISKAKSFCSSGGYSGDFTPTPETNCTPVIDPYASLPVPSLNGCTKSRYKSSNGTNNISPGIYCDGMSLQNGTVNLAPGVYVIKDGALKIANKEPVTGNGVTFYLYGDAYLDMAGQSVLDLSAPKSGPYAGMLFISHPDAGGGKKFQITGQATTKLVGVSYFPNQVLDIGGNGEFGANSKFMGLVADTIQLRGNGRLKFNLDPEAEGYEDITLPGKLSIPRLSK